MKGSSATLGLVKVRDACEKIQHWGQRKDEHGEGELENDRCLKKIKDIIPQVREDCSEAETRMKAFYGLS